MVKQFIMKHMNLSQGGANLPKFSLWILSLLHGYNHEKYWRRWKKVVDNDSKTNFIFKLYYFLWLKRVDGKQHCSFGTNLNYGALFSTPPPLLPHGPSGIIIGHDAKIGKDAVIFQQVTIAAGKVSIGDYVTIGAGAKILPHVTIGNHCKIGANAVVVEDMPDYSTCVLQKPRIILKDDPKG